MKTIARLLHGVVAVLFSFGASSGKGKKMIQHINTVEDVKTFFNELHAEGLNFHPDDLFEDYVHRDTGELFYSDHETLVRNNLLAQAFDVCEREDADIYELCIEIFMKDFYAAFPPEE